MTDYGDENPLHMDFYGFPPAVRKTGPLEVGALSDYLHYVIALRRLIQVDGRLWFLGRDCRDIDEGK